MNKIALGILSIIVLGSSPLAFAASDIEVFGEESSITVNLEESIGLTTEEPEKINLAPLAPLKQIKEGVEPKNIQCKESLELIFKSSGEPACVKETSVQKLISRGWTQ